MAKSNINDVRLIAKRLGFAIETDSPGDGRVRIHLTKSDRMWAFVGSYAAECFLGGYEVAIADERKPAPVPAHPSVAHPLAVVDSIVYYAEHGAIPIIITSEMQRAFDKAFDGHNKIAVLNQVRNTYNLSLYQSLNMTDWFIERGVLKVR